jgi:hypothetical protein
MRRRCGAPRAVRVDSSASRSLACVSPGDVFVTPSWASVDHQAEIQADLFAISDQPVLQVPHLYHEEELAKQQEIIGTFVPLKGVSRNDK